MFKKKTEELKAIELVEKMINDNWPYHKPEDWGVAMYVIRSLKGKVEVGDDD